MKGLTQELLLSAFLSSLAFGLQAEDAVLKVTSAAGEPGDAVAIQFRATFSKPLIAFRIHFKLSEDISDPVVFLQYLFQGGKTLPAPGPRTPWFDATPDVLDCTERTVG